MTLHQRHQVAILWADLEHSVRAIGQDGGLVSPAIYDTAQCLRFNPPATPWPIVDWLLEQQQADGGWLEPGLAKARYLPTLAVLLALKSLNHIRRTSQDAIEAGLMFLHQQQWTDWATLDDLPLGADLILPRLVDDAQTAGLAVDPRPYAPLIALGAQRRSRLQTSARQPDQAARHLWEGWGTVLMESLVDNMGTVGQSPAASAFWLHAARTDPALATLCAQVRQGLLHAEAATRSPIPGVVGTQWPLTTPERVYSLHALLLAGMVGPTAAYALPTAVQVAVDQQLSLLQDTVRASTTRSLEPGRLDPATTALAVTILTVAGYAVPPKAITQVEQTAARQIEAWRTATPRSLAGSAHMLHALATMERSTLVADYQALITARQLPTGIWPGEPEQHSAIITTATVILALLASGQRAQLAPLCQSLALFQHRAGGWGAGAGTAEETAYAVLALGAARRHQCLPASLGPALERAKHWLMAQYHPFGTTGAALWHGKERYRPLRIAHSVELAALITLLLPAKTIAR